MRACLSRMLIYVSCLRTVYCRWKYFIQRFSAEVGGRATRNIAQNPDHKICCSGALERRSSAWTGGSILATTRIVSTALDIKAGYDEVGRILFTTLLR